MEELLGHQSYQLQGVVCFEGNNVQNGKYKVYARRPVRDKMIQIAAKSAPITIQSFLKALKGVG